MNEVVIDQTSATPADHVSKAWRDYQSAKRARRALERRVSVARKTEAAARGKLVHVYQRLTPRAGSGEAAAATAAGAAR
jgi:hypothetical protein